MGLFTELKDSISRVTDRLFSEQEPKRIGIYGPPNAGKTTLANRIARDWTGDAVGAESHIPHETRRARRKENVEIERNGRKVTIDIVDTPGVTTKVDYKESWTTTWRRTTPSAGRARRPRASRRRCTGSARTSTASSTCSTRRRTRSR